MPSNPPCPFCGETDRLKLANLLGLCVQCQRCGAAGPPNPTTTKPEYEESRAWAGWAERAGAKGERLAKAGERFAAILAAVERARSGGHAECLAELRRIDREARLGEEVTRDA